MNIFEDLNLKVTREGRLTPKITKVIKQWSNSEFLANGNIQFPEEKMEEDEEPDQILETEEEEEDETELIEERQPTRPTRIRKTPDSNHLSVN